MIEESTMIQILDIDIGESKPKPVLEVYREYLYHRTFFNHL